MNTGQAPASATGRPAGPPGGIIHTEDLTKVYPGMNPAAVDWLNLDVQAGEIFGLRGHGRARAGPGSRRSPWAAGTGCRRSC